MNKDKRLTILIILIVTLSLVGIGIAFAAFSQTLTINGTGEVEASSWKVVFEGMTNVNTIDAPTTTGTASEVTHPTIKNNSTEISTYSVSLKTPGDSITYNFKIHNKGDFAANLSSLTISGVNRPSSPVSGASLVTDSSIATANSKTLSKVEYKFYYTIDNTLVGQNPARDCLEAGETANVSLKITFSSSKETDTEVLPSTDLVLDNLGITSTYTQTTNDTCPIEPGYEYSGPFLNMDYAYYTYEDKSFKGTGVNNVIISERVIGLEQYSSSPATDMGVGANPRYIFEDSPAIDMAVAYCTGCRLMTRAEATSWGCSNNSSAWNEKCNSSNHWWLADSAGANYAYYIILSNGKSLISYNTITVRYSVRPVTDIPSTATMTGSGTQLDPYVINTN